MSAKLVVFDNLFALVYNGVCATILWDSNEQKHIGILTITDFIRILHQYYQYQRSLVYITPENTLLDAVRMLLKHKVHRLQVIDPASENPLHILTHKRVLKYLHIHISELPTPSFMVKKLRDLNPGTMKNVCIVQQNCPVHKALQHFIDRGVSALPLVDQDGQVVDIYAKFDVINSAATRTYQNLDITVYEASNYRHGKFQGVARCQMDHTLEMIVNKIVDAGVHRLVVVAENKVLGIVACLNHWAKEITFYEND
ncbi:unnamed protein product [Trichobilharzia regenti]|nr:unnamed protein product [Trichobilharzia regenti]